MPDGSGAPEGAVTYNITCSDVNYTNMITYYEETGTVNNLVNCFGIYYYDGNILFVLYDSEGDSIDDDNWEDYKDLAFTIAMADGSSGGSDSEDSGSQTEPTLKSFTIGTLMEKCTEVIGTDGGTYYDISVQDFNELIGYDILKLESFIYPAGSENTNDSTTIVVESDSESPYGVLRAISYNTDPYIYNSLDVVLFMSLAFGITDHGLVSEDVLREAGDPVHKFLIDENVSGTEDDSFRYRINHI